MGSTFFQFEWPWLLFFLPLPLLIRLLPAEEQNQVALRVPFFRRLPIPKLSFGEDSMTRRLPLLVRSIIWILLVFSAARPQWIGEPVELPVSGRSIMLAVDLSGSMKERDLELQGKSVTRLEVVKSVLHPFIQRRDGDRLGLILFGNQAYLQTPLTFDRVTLGYMLDESEIGLAGERTAIGDAIGLAVKRMLKLGEDEKVLILLTDGRNTAGNIKPRLAAELAKEAGLRIHSIGVGADEMWVRSLLGKRKVNPSAELDEGMLLDLSRLTGGKYFRARSRVELERIYELIDELEPVEKDLEAYRPMRALFHWSLASAWILGLFWFIKQFFSESISQRI